MPHSTSWCLINYSLSQNRIGVLELVKEHKQKLSFCKQIARQLRTQYVEGLYRHKYYTVTLKSNLGVTQGH